MKKLMVAVVSAASAIFAFGDLPHGADFEAEGFVVGESFTNYLDKGDGAVSEGTLYWEASIPGEEIGSIAAYTGTGRIGVDDVPDIYTNALTNAKYLQLDSGKNRLLRNIAEGGAAVPMSTGDGIYLDTLVKFSAASSLLDSDFESGDKLAIAYVGELDDGNYLSNFVVRAGFIGESQPTNYLVEVANFDVEDWHRLTIRTLTNIDGNRAGFKIYLDGQALAYSTGDDRFAQSAGFVDDTHTIFPSAVATGIYRETISAVAFAGNGSIDDVVFTTETPKFIKDTESVVATFTVDSGVTAISVQVGSAEPIVVDMNNLEAILPPGTDEFTVTATIDGANGYTFARMTYNNGVFTTNPATITGYAGGAIAITTTRSNFSVFDENGDPISGTYTTLGAALAAQGVAKIQLDFDYTVADWESIPLNQPVYEIDGEIVLNLNGNTLDGGASDYDEMFYVSGAMTVIDSVGGGKIVYGGTAGMFSTSSDLAIGAATGDVGVFIDGVLFVDGYEGDLVRANVRVADNTEADELVWSPAPGSKCADEPVNGYWVVTPSAAPQPTTYALTLPTGVNATAKVTANDVEVDDITAIDADTEVVVTWTALEGYKITLGATENITMDSDKTAATPTVVAITYATLTITQVDNCTIVVSNATEEVATGAKFDVDDAVQLTVYRTPASSYELDGYAATEQITMDQDQTVTAAVKSSGGSYPSYIDDPTKQAKYDTWKSDMAAAGVDVGDGAACEDAYLLNCKPTEVEAAKAAFKFTSISYDTTESKWVTTTTTGYNERTYNGTVTVIGYSDVGCTVQNAAGPFFKATLD